MANDPTSKECFMVLDLQEQLWLLLDAVNGSSALGALTNVQLRATPVPVSVPDGADATLGSTTDPAATTINGTAMAFLKLLFDITNNASVFWDTSNSGSVFIDNVAGDAPSVFVDHSSGRSVFLDQLSGFSAFIDTISKKSAFIDQVTGKSAFIDQATGRSAFVDPGTGASVFQTQAYGAGNTDGNTQRVVLPYDQAAIPVNIAGYSAINIATATTTQVATGFAVLHGIVINTKGTVASTVEVYNSVGTTTDKIATIDSLNLSGTFLFDANCANGIYIVTTGTVAPDITVLWR